MTAGTTAATGSRITFTLTGPRSRASSVWDFQGFLGSIDLGTWLTVRLTDGTQVVGTFKDYSGLFATDRYVAVVKDGQRRATRVRFDQIRSVTGIKGAPLGELLSAYIIAGDPAAGL
jgi:hypothetical protein